MKLVSDILLSFWYWAGSVTLVYANTYLP
jgi:hypothetical protein